MQIEIIEYSGQGEGTFVAYIYNENSWWYADVKLELGTYVRTAKFYRRDELLRNLKSGELRILDSNL